jgi:hypothetical protein
MSNPFDDDWQDVQQAYYQHTVRSSDKSKRADIHDLMQQLGYTEDELLQLYIDATLHDAPHDFEPDFDLLEKLRKDPHPLECQCPTCRK